MENASLISTPPVIRAAENGDGCLFSQIAVDDGLAGPDHNGDVIVVAELDCPVLWVFKILYNGTVTFFCLR